MPAQYPFLPGRSFNTSLALPQEWAFRNWLQQNKVPFNPDAKASDYDMRGFWQAMQSQSPMARSAINPNDGRMHYPDYWKTPLHESFSRESQWAPPDAPTWINDSQLADKGGRVLFDERQSGGLLDALRNMR